MGKLSGTIAVDVRSLTISAGASQTAAFDAEGYVMFGLLMPTGWTAANVSFLAATATGGTFRPIYDDTGSEVTLTATASRAIGITGAAADALTPWTILKIRSGTAAAPVNQAVARSIKVRLKT